MSELKNDNSVNDFDLFEITYSLWKNKYTIISSIIISTFIALAISVFEKKNNSIYVEIGPNTTDSVFLNQLSVFNIDTPNIFRNYLANLKTRKIITRTLKATNPTLDIKYINEQTSIIISQLEIKLAENELASEFQETTGFKFYKINYTSDGNIDDKKKFIRALIDENNNYFINNFNRTMDTNIEYDKKVFVSGLDSKTSVLKNESKSEFEQVQISRVYKDKSNILDQNKFISNNEQNEINDERKFYKELISELDSLEKNLIIAKKFGIKNPKYVESGDLKIGSKRDFDYFSFILGTEVLNQRIQANKDMIASKKNGSKIMTDEELVLMNNLKNKELVLLKQNQELKNQLTNLKRIRSEEIKELQLREINQKKSQPAEYLNDGFRTKLIIRDFMRDFMSEDDFMLIEETSSIGSAEEKNLIKYLIIFITVGFLISSAWIFFNEARIKRNISL